MAGVMPATTVTIASATVAEGLASQTSRPTRGGGRKVPRTESRISFQRSARLVGLSGSGGSSTTGGPEIPEVLASSLGVVAAVLRLGRPRQGPPPFEDIMFGSTYP